MTIRYTYYAEDGSEEILSLPSEIIVCPRCGGRGVHDCWEGGMTGDEMAEQGPEFFEDYMSGMYDKLCSECHGRNVIEVVDREVCEIYHAEDLRKYDEQEDERASMEAESLAERRMEHNAACALMGIRDYW